MQSIIIFTFTLLGSAMTDGYTLRSSTISKERNLHLIQPRADQLSSSSPVPQGINAYSKIKGSGPVDLSVGDMWHPNEYTMQPGQSFEAGHQDPHKSMAFANIPSDAQNTLPIKVKAAGNFVSAHISPSADASGELKVKKDGEVRRYTIRPNQELTQSAQSFNRFGVKMTSRMSGPGSAMLLGTSSRFLGMSDSNSSASSREGSPKSDPRRGSSRRVRPPPKGAQTGPETRLRAATSVPSRSSRSGIRSGQGQKRSESSSRMN